MKIMHANDLPESFFQYLDIESLDAVHDIIEAVRRNGDEALRHYTTAFDGVTPERFRVEPAAVKAAYARVDDDTVAAIQAAADNIRAFAELQKGQLSDFETELRPGVFTGQKVIPLRRVGVYVPGGAFPLVSTLLMGVMPALVAGVDEVAVCSPPSYEGDVHPVILVAADRVGVSEIYRVGGAQSIAAMAWGTASIPPVDKIVGPGNRYVAEAKKQVFGVVGIDLIAGPTEVMIVADDGGDPEVIAADLLAQAEHDRHASPLMVTTSRELAEAVSAAVARQLPELTTREIAEAALEGQGCIILVDDLVQAADVVNRKAPEHLEVQLADLDAIVPMLRNFGSLFTGEWTAEVLGDYSSGINHTLPTNTTARYRGGLSVHDFLKIHTTLRVEPEGFDAIGPVAKQLAIAEGLDGHRLAVLRRMEKRGNG